MTIQILTFISFFQQLDLIVMTSKEPLLVQLTSTELNVIKTKLSAHFLETKAKLCGCCFNVQLKGAIHSKVFIRGILYLLMLILF
jgi:hypothetical protein